MATHSEDEQDQILMNGIASERLSSDYVSVSQFYSGRSVFITGGTGFMGKVCIFFFFFLSFKRLILKIISKTYILGNC